MKYVYILKAGNDHYKVGIARSVKKRVYAIQTSNAYKVYVVAVRLCSNAERVERKLHAKLIDMSTAGGTEWFKLTPEDVIRVCILLNSEPELNVYDNAILNEQLANQYELLKLVDARIKTFINNSSQTISNAQVQVNNNLGVPETTIKAERQQRREIEAETLYLRAMRVVIESSKASTSMLQRRLEIGYGRAARLMDQLEANGVVESGDGIHSRKVLKSDI